MNANELADKLRKSINNNEKHLDLDIKAITMLRQQQAEIEALKSEKSNSVYEDKPVALMHPTNKKHRVSIHASHASIGTDDWIPLYTTPQIIPLTEDECESIINRHDWFSKSWKEMAKEIHDAIIKKARE